MAINSTTQKRRLKLALEIIRKKNKSHKRWILIAATAFSILVLGKAAGDSVYDYEPNPNIDKIGNATLIVCLAGGKGRIQSALSLYSQGKGLAVFIAGAGPKSTRDTIINEYLPSISSETIPDYRKTNIIVETQSRNTIENAYAISRFLRNNPEITDIILITSAYHMRRSLLILKNALRNNVTIHPYTAKESAFTRDNWDNSLTGIGVTLEEYGKLLLAKIFIPMLEMF